MVMYSKVTATVIRGPQTPDGACASCSETRRTKRKRWREGKQQIHKAGRAHQFDHFIKDERVRPGTSLFPYSTTPCCNTHIRRFIWTFPSSYATTTTLSDTKSQKLIAIIPQITMKDSKEMNEEIAEVEDHSALAEIHAAVCMARDARLAQKVSEGSTSGLISVYRCLTWMPCRTYITITNTRLPGWISLRSSSNVSLIRVYTLLLLSPVYLASLSGGKPDPLFFTPIPTTLYLYEGCLTSGLVQGNDCLKYWIHPPGQVLDLRDDQVTRVHVPGQTIHLLRTAKQRERKQSQETAGIPLGEFTTPVNQVSTSTAFPLPIEAKFNFRVLHYQIIQKRMSVPSLLPKRHLKPETPSPPTKPSSSPPAAPQAPSSKLMPRRPGKVGSRKPRRIDA